MDRRERYGDQQIALLAAFQGWQAGIWTALPCRVEQKGGVSSFNPQERTVTLQPLIQAYVQGLDGQQQWVTLPPLVDCPVVFPSGGGVTLTFPIRVGDEGLAIFASRCIDSWWQSGGIQNQPELRMHTLSDGFFLPGVSSKPHVIPNISTTCAQLRDDAGSTRIELDPGGAFINITTPGNVGVHAGGDLVATINGTTTITSQGAAVWNVPAGLQINGNVSIDGAVVATGEGTFNGGHTVSQHTHNQGADSHGDIEEPTDPPQG